MVSEDVEINVLIARGAKGENEIRNVVQEATSELFNEGRVRFGVIGHVGEELRLGNPEIVARGLGLTSRQCRDAFVLTFAAPKRFALEEMTLRGFDPDPEDPNRMRKGNVRLFVLPHVPEA